MSEQMNPHASVTPEHSQPSSRLRPCPPQCAQMARKHAMGPVLHHGTPDTPSCQGTGQGVSDTLLSPKHTSTLETHRAKAQGNIQSAGGDHTCPTAKAARCPGEADAWISDSPCSARSKGVWKQRAFFTDARWSLKGTFDLGQPDTAGSFLCPPHCEQKPSTPRLVRG